MEHSSGFRRPSRGFKQPTGGRRTKHDHAARNYQKHMAERFRARQAQQAEEAPAEAEDDETSS